MQCKSEPSPLARGTLSPFIYRRKAHRFIPACAGNSTASTRTVLMSAVHPRLRGELFSEGLPAGVLCGSSPLARGTREHHLASFLTTRFIPACAGNSARFRRITQPISVHPRLRGELMIYVRPALIRFGSSPLARGTPSRTLRRKPSIRFIPACAGNSISDGPSIVVDTVHPRLRGELR